MNEIIELPGNRGEFVTVGGTKATFTRRDLKRGAMVGTINGCFVTLASGGRMELAHDYDQVREWLEEEVEVGSAQTKEAWEALAKARGKVSE